MRVVLPMVLCAFVLSACRTQSADDASRALYDVDPKAGSLAERLREVDCIAKVADAKDGILTATIIGGKNPGDCADAARAALPGLNVKEVKAQELLVASETFGAPDSREELFQRMGAMNCVAGVEEEMDGIPQHPETYEPTGNLNVKTRNGKATLCSGWVAAAFPGVVVLEVFDSINEFRVRAPKL